jgi:RHS repeat-associated protein
VYDAVGNLTQAVTPAGTTNRTYDLADRVTTSGYTYDDNGALTADPARGYGYDGFGRLTSISGTTAASYSLDGTGNRVAQTVAGVTTSFDLDVSAANPTILADGTRRYLPGDPSAGYDLAGTWYSALADQAGSAHSTVSSAGTQSSITRYDPFGAARPGSTIPAGIGYAGEWADPTGLVNLRARAYDPAAGRFTSRDGVAGLAPAPQTANRYSYALNGPYRYSDPSGHFVNAIYQNAPFLVSMALTFTPGIGLAYGGFMAVTGYDPITGHHLSDLERGLAILPIAGKAFSTLSHLGEGAADAGRLAKADDLASIGRAEGGGARGSIALDSSSARALASSNTTVAAQITEHVAGRQMIMSQTAANEFARATARLAGPAERQAAQRLMSQVKVVADNPSARVAGLRITRAVSPSDINIFGTADRMGIPILTSDARFGRGAAAQGVHLDVIVHDPMSFTGR